MTSFKTNEIDSAVKSLDSKALDMLMKYIYKGFEFPTDGSSASLLTWHEKVTLLITVNPKSASHNCIKQLSKLNSFNCCLFQRKYGLTFLFKQCLAASLIFSEKYLKRVICYDFARHFKG